MSLSQYTQAPSNDSSRLITIHTRRKSPHLRLLCFPYAGGSTASFIPWSQLLPETVEVAMVTLPGRGNRLFEPAYADMHEIVVNLFGALQGDRSGLPYVFYGHSMGARVAYELMIYMDSKGYPLPIHYFASGSIAPTRTRKKKAIHQLPDDEFIRALGRMNSSSREVFANQELANLLLPSLRTDFKIVETYKCANPVRLECGISVFAGLRDNEANLANILPWHDLFTHNTGINWFEGNHFFVDSHRIGVTKEINDVLATLPLKHR